MRRIFFLTDTESVKYPAKSGRPVIVTGKANASKVKEKLEVMADKRFVLLLKLLAYRYRGCISYESIFVSTKDIYHKYMTIQVDCLLHYIWINPRMFTIRNSMCYNIQSSLIHMEIIMVIYILYIVN